MQSARVKHSMWLTCHVLLDTHQQAQGNNPVAGTVHGAWHPCGPLGSRCKASGTWAVSEDSIIWGQTGSWEFSWFWVNWHHSNSLKLAMSRIYAMETGKHAMHGGLCLKFQHLGSWWHGPEGCREMVSLFDTFCFEIMSLEEFFLQPHSLSMWLETWSIFIIANDWERLRSKTNLSLTVFLFLFFFSVWLYNLL